MRKVAAAFALAALACAGVHVALAGGTFLSDDFSHLSVIYRNDVRGALGQWVAARFVEPLGNASFAYRPLAFASYALDWRLYGTTAEGWRATSLILVAANAICAVVLLRRWLDGRATHARAGAWTAGCLLAAYPFAGEISYWLVGRFDLLACLFSLLYFLSLPLDRPSTLREHAQRLAFLTCALWSKESAIPLPAVASLVLASAAVGTAGARAALRRLAVEMGPSFALLVAYFAWRVALFGSALKVYASTTAPASVGEWWERWSGLRDIALANVGAWWIAWAIACGGLALTIGAMAWRSSRMAEGDAGRRPRAIMLALPLVAGFALYAASPALSFPVSSPGGEGGRHFYLAWLYASLAAGALVSMHPRAWMPALALVALCVVAQAGSLRQWHAAGVTMARVTPAIGRFAGTLRDDQYALLLLPDHMGAALFARTSQGALVAPPIQARDELSRLAPTLGTDFRHWSAMLTDGTVAKLKGASAFDLSTFTGLYCWNDMRRAIVPLTPGGDLARDPARWEAVAREAFARAGCLEPF